MQPSLRSSDCVADIGSRSVRCHAVASIRLDHEEIAETGKNQAIEKRQKEIWFGALGKPYLHAAQLSPVPSCWDNIVECRR
jgi:hypothetical protein